MLLQPAARFVGQADADQRAAGALRAVGQRRRNDPPGGDGPQLPQQLAGAIDQGVVQRDRDPLAGIDVVEDAALAQVAVLPQDQPLARVGLAPVPRRCRARRVRGRACNRRGPRSRPGYRPGPSWRSAPRSGPRASASGYGSAGSREQASWSREQGAGSLRARSRASELGSVGSRAGARRSGRGHRRGGGRIGLRGRRGCRRTRPGPIRDRPCGQ